MDEKKKAIIELFERNVKGKTADTSNQNRRHDGRKGYWLETQMGIIHNGDNAPDLHGFEMKNKTTSGKITFGDWSADEYIFIADRNINEINKEFQFSRNDFFKVFGKPNPEKANRLSWSGIPCPTYYGDITLFGQELTMDNEENIIIMYHFSKDSRNNKSSIVPAKMQKDNLVIAKWYKTSLKKKLEDKFNQNGWFTCSTDQDGKYDHIHFGLPMNYDSWISLFKKKIVFFDSGMYETNKRPYSQWRASTGFWHSLIVETY